MRIENHTLSEQDSRNQNPPVSSFRATLDAVRRRMSADTLSDRAFGSELALIVCEVLRLDPVRCPVIRIGGVELDLQMVQEIYSEFGADHAEAVMRAYKMISYPVRNKKAFLRTMIYNSVFELESGAVNEVAVDFH